MSNTYTRIQKNMDRFGQQVKQQCCTEKSLLQTNLSWNKIYDKQTYEEVRRNRWVDRQTGRQTGRHTDDSLHSLNKQTEMTSTAAIWVTEQQTPPHAFADSRSHLELFSSHTHRHPDITIAVVSSEQLARILSSWGHQSISRTGPEWPFTSG